MSVTRETSQWGMVISHSRSPTHASTAALSSALVVTSGMHTASVSTRSVHDVTPSSTYPVSHVGTQDVAAHEGIGAVADGAVEGRQGRVARVVVARPPATGEGVSVPPVNLAFHASAE